ncbi:MAG: phospholipid scramblase-related protein [Candidatus Rifleibacteriota bacterium]
MRSIAYRKKYLVTESIGATKLYESYLVIDPETRETLAEIVEEASTGHKIAKVFLDKAFLPVKLVMRSADGHTIMEMSQPASLFSAAFTVRNADGRVLCVFKQKFSLIKPEILVEDGQGQKIGRIEGGWKFRNFQFKDNNNNVLATIGHQYGGFARELLTTADDYEVTMSADAEMALITLASVICIDFFYHES